MPKASPKTTKGATSQIAPTRKAPRRISVDELLNAQGGSGTYIVNGFLEGDYNSALSGRTGLEKYDEMRKSDSKVRQSLMVCKLPILSTEWYFDAAKDPETDEVGEAEQEVADFCSKALFEKMDQSWTEHLTEVLTLLEFGFSAFEKVYTADDEDDFIWLKKIASRKQTTIDRWEMLDGSPGIVQQLPSQISDPDHPNFGHSQIEIPSSKMLLFSYQKEGDNYTGVSVLRSAYRHWYIKDALYKFDAIRHERQGVGIPIIKLPKNALAKDKAEALAILKNIRANEQGGIVLPNSNWEFMFADLQAGNVSDIWKSIDHHNNEIANNVLAMFLNLVSGDGGSRALSEDQSDFFLLSLESLANLIEDVYNRHLIPELVDLNFEVTEYPKLRHRKLGSVDYSTITNVISTLVGAGVIEADEDLEEWARSIIDAPKKVIFEDDEIDPEIDPITGEPIEPDPNDELLDDEMIDEEMLDDEELDDEELEASEFRVVSEATKRKISESLKRVLPGDTQQSLARAKAEAATRKGQRHQRALRNAQMRKAQRRKGQSSSSSNAPAAPEARPRSKLSKAIRDISTRKKSGGASDMKSRVAARLRSRVKKKLDHEGRNSDDKSLSKAVTKAQAKSSANAASSKVKGIKEAAKNASKATKKGKKGKAQRDKIKVETKAQTDKIKQGQSASKDVSTEKANTVRRGEKVVKDAKKAASALKKATAAIKKKKSKKKISAHDHSVSDYERIFAETSRAVLAMQKAIPRTFDSTESKPFVFKESSYESWRPLTFAEQKVDWRSLNKTMEKFKQALDLELDQITGDQKADLLIQVKRAVEGNNIVAVGTIRAKYTGELSSALTNIQKEMFEVGKVSASIEMAVKAPATAREVMGALKVGNDKLVQKMTSDMESAAALAVTQTIARKGGSISGTGTAEAVSAASQAIDKVLESKGRVHTLTLMGSINLGRSSIFERYPEKIYGFQYSAIIDNATTDLCLSLDGRTVASGSPDFYEYAPPQHYNCRSLWVEILQEEEFKPETDDIPSRISSNSTIDVFEDLDAPIVEKGSPAIKVLQEEIDWRKNKVDEYEKSGQYQNRIESHQSRIDALENAIGDE